MNLVTSGWNFRLHNEERYIMKRCTYCITMKNDKDFGTTVRTKGVSDNREGDGILCKVAYLQSWCKECTKRYSRIKRGTETVLDMLSELSIKIKKEC